MLLATELLHGEVFTDEMEMHWGAQAREAWKGLRSRGLGDPRRLSHLQGFTEVVAKGLLGGTPPPDLDRVLQVWIQVAVSMASACHRKRTAEVFELNLVARDVYGRAKEEHQKLLGNRKEVMIRPPPPKEARHKTRLAKSVATAASTTAKADAEAHELER